MVLSKKRWNAEHKDEHYSEYYGDSPWADLLCFSGHLVFPQTTESILRQRRAAAYGILRAHGEIAGPAFRANVSGLAF
jgi:hypothetical protein